MTARAAIYLKLGRFDDASGGNADLDAARSIDPNAAAGFEAWYGIAP